MKLTDVNYNYITYVADVSDLSIHGQDFPERKPFYVRF